MVAMDTVIPIRRLFLFMIMGGLMLNIIGLKRAEAQIAPALFVFGDSLVDVGNNNHLPMSLAKANFPHNGLDFPAHKPTGRFSNGKNAADFIAEKLGLPSSPPYLSEENNKSFSFLTGVSFASGGAGILDGPDKHFQESITMNEQVEYFGKVQGKMVQNLGQGGADKILSKAVFVFVVGSNDIFNRFGSSGNSTQSKKGDISPQEYVDSMLLGIKSQLKESEDPRPTRREINLGSSTAPRHIHSRGVTASARRARDEQLERQMEIERMRQQMVLDAAHLHAEPQQGLYDQSGYQGMEMSSDFVAGAAAADDDDDDDEGAFDNPIHQGASQYRKDARGRFIGSSSTSGSSKRSRGDEDRSWLVTGPVPGGPVDGSVIPSFLGHVASRMWSGNMRGVLKCQNRGQVRGTLNYWWREMRPQVRETIQSTGLAHLVGTMFDHIDTPLISAFVERWQPDTNSFHMPFGEMTITLHDVHHILRVPVDGQSISAEPSSTQLQSAVMMLLGGITRDELTREGLWDGGGVRTNVISQYCAGEHVLAETEAVAWTWIMLGATLFVDKSGNRVRGSLLHELGEDLVGVDRYSWGSAALAYLYRQLGIASRGEAAGVSGCLTLLQAWIYEYFPCFRPHADRLDLPHANTPRACAWNVGLTAVSEQRLASLRLRLDDLHPGEVTWLPFGANVVRSCRRTIFDGLLRYRDIIEPYMPGRVIRQLGYMQDIPQPVIEPMRAFRPWEAKRYVVTHAEASAKTSWASFPRSCSLVLDLYERNRDDYSRCTQDYMEWYRAHSHPRLVNNQPRQRPRVPRHSDYWVSRFIDVTRTVITHVREPDEAEADTALLEDTIREWNLSE